MPKAKQGNDFRDVINPCGIWNAITEMCTAHLSVPALNTVGWAKGSE